MTGTINETALREHGLIRGNFDGIKVLGNGEIKKKLAIEADYVSASAREKIEAAGGSVTLRPQKAVQTKQPRKKRLQTRKTYARLKPRRRPALRFLCDGTAVVQMGGRFDGAGPRLPLRR